MLFYRSKASESGNGPSLATTRTLLAISLAAYPAGCLILALGPDGRGGLFAFEIAGLALILVAFLAAAPVLGSHFQRIVADQPRQLDEFELKIRQQAMSAAYAAFTALTLLVTIYAAIASDKGWWVPRSYEEFNALFWGIFLYACLLPTLFLVWRPGAAEDLADAEDRS